MIIENTNITLAKLDDEIKGAEIILSDSKINLLQKVEILISDADIVMAKIFGHITRILEEE